MQDGAGALHRLLGIVPARLELGRNIDRHLQTPLHGGPAGNGIKPTFEIVEPLDGHTGPGMDPHPAPVGDVGDGLITGEVFDLGQS